MPTSEYAAGTDAPSSVMLHAERPQAVSGSVNVATAPLKLLARGDSGAIADLAGILFGAANLAVAAVMIGTVLLAMRGKLFAKTVTFRLLAHGSPAR